MFQDEFQRIEASEYKHWWYRVLHTLVLVQIKKYFKNTDLKIIDAGCGTGGLISFLKQEGYHNIDGFDISDIAIEICNRRGISAFNGDMKDIIKYYEMNCADVIISNDTLYFLDMEEQKTLTDNMNSLLREGGLLIMNMPSFKAFRGIHDVQVGIKKRFEPEDTWKIFDKEKYSLVTKMYWPFFLSPVIWMSRYMQRLKMRFNPRTRIRSDLKNEILVINSLLFSLTNAENKMLRTKPFGSSLFLVMQKITPNSGNHDSKKQQ